MLWVLHPRSTMLQVLFFSTILANLAGRTLPKWKQFAVQSPFFLMYLGFLKLALAPVCFLYLKSGDRWHNDAAAAGEHYNIDSYGYRYACHIAAHALLSAIELQMGAAPAGPSHCVMS